MYLYNVGGVLLLRSVIYISTCIHMHINIGVQAVAASPISSWSKVWDSALEKGAFGTSCSLTLLRLPSLHTFSEFPVPNCSYVVGEDSLCSHFLADHTTLSITAEVC